MSQHTPGFWWAARTSLNSISSYWNALKQLSQISVIAAPSQPRPTPIAIVLIPPSGTPARRAEELVANAELLAAAPQLLSAARVALAELKEFDRVTGYDEDKDFGPTPFVTALRDAIYAATSKKPSL